MTVYYHGRPRDRRPPAVGRRVHLGSKRPGDPWVATTEPGAGRQRLVAQQGQPGRRARQPAGGPHRAGSHGRGVERPAAQHRLPTATAPPPTSGSSPIADQQLRDRGATRGATPTAARSTTGETGPLTLDFWPLAENEDAARRQWTQARRCCSCFEHWFGPYPWYDDGFKLIESPHLGMEHQSAVAYGNGSPNGYRGRDCRARGSGLKWDFIIVHETAHEWCGNNITTKDVADMWVHESFANYCGEPLHRVPARAKQAGAEYVIGTRREHPERRARSSGAYGVERAGLGRHVLQGRQHAAHHPPARRRRRAVARGSSAA